MFRFTTPKDVSAFTPEEGPFTHAEIASVFLNIEHGYAEVTVKQGTVENGEFKQGRTFDGLAKRYRIADTSARHDLSDPADPTSPLVEAAPEALAFTEMKGAGDGGNSFKKIKKAIWKVLKDYEDFDGDDDE